MSKHARMFKVIPGIISFVPKAYDASEHGPNDERIFHR